MISSLRGPQSIHAARHLLLCLVLLAIPATALAGVKVFDLSNARDRLWAEGGYDSVRDGSYQVHVDMEDHD